MNRRQFLGSIAAGVCVKAVPAHGLLGPTNTVIVAELADVQPAEHFKHQKRNFTCHYPSWKGRCGTGGKLCEYPVLGDIVWVCLMSRSCGLAKGWHEAEGIIVVVFDIPPEHGGGWEVTVSLAEEWE